MRIKEFEEAKCRTCSFKKYTYGIHKGDMDDTFVAQTLMMFDKHSKCCDKPNYFTYSF